MSSFVCYYCLTTALLVCCYCLTTALLQIFNERATPELSDWDRYAKIEYQRLAMEEDQVFLCVPICLCITYQVRYSNLIGTDTLILYLEYQRLAMEEDQVR